MKTKKIENLIIDTLKDLKNENDIMIPGELDRDTPLYGRNATLDSITIVMVVVGLEQAIEEETGIAVSLSDEKTIAQSPSPYLTVGTLADYAVKVMEKTTA